METKSAKELFGKAPEGCTCQWEKEGKGWILHTRCEVCENIQQAQNAILDNVREIQEKRTYLVSTDYKVIRQRDQIAAQSTPSLSDEEYQQLLSDRQSARNRINELEAQL